MPPGHVTSLGHRNRITPQLRKCCLGSPHRHGMINHRQWIAAAHLAPAPNLEIMRHRPRLMEIGERHPLKFWHPASDEHTGRALLHRLLRRVVDSQRVDAGRPALHLHLRPVNTWLKVEKLTSQVKACRPPRQPQRVAGK